LHRHLVRDETARRKLLDLDHLVSLLGVSALPRLR
jgi:hypothetical protein